MDARRDIESELIEGVRYVRCPYCSKRVQRERLSSYDHVFPVSLYFDPVPSDAEAPQVRSCECNNRFSAIEGRLLREMVPGLSADPRAASLLARFQRAIDPDAAVDEEDKDHRRKALESLARGIRFKSAEEVGAAGAAQARDFAPGFVERRARKDQPVYATYRVGPTLRVLEKKLIKGMYAWTRGAVLPEDVEIHMRRTTTRKAGKLPAMIAECEMELITDLPGFRCYGRFDGEAHSMWLFVLWDLFVTRAAVVPGQ